MSVRRKRRGIYQELLLAKQLLGRTVNHYQSLSCGFNVVTQLEEPFLTAEFWDYLLSGDCAEKVSDLDSIECRYIPPASQVRRHSLLLINSCYQSAKKIHFSFLSLDFLTNGNFKCVSQ
ncbi:uncharacterized protein LOC118741673 isoform X1 [Rhagoletis pomonella]|uniref:uncharacterized protein LOC118741673 isoform X1 n=1 Tax=Rhagoletis pomonella TaxID=28610 RepID=UPI00177FB490|nr:uncharacterized protein LOC118741673 isoform X1 [Rhagoletis pomonella]